MEKIRGMKIYSEKKMRGLKILSFSEENTPGGYSTLKMTSPLEKQRIFRKNQHQILFEKKTFFQGSGLGPRIAIQVSGVHQLIVRFSYLEHFFRIMDFFLTQTFWLLLLLIHFAIHFFPKKLDRFHFWIKFYGNFVGPIRKIL